MKHRKKEELTENGHIVMVRDKTRLILRESFPTYGSAMRAIVVFEEQYPNFEVEYRDVRVFRTDTY